MINQDQIHGTYSQSTYRCNYDGSLVINQDKGGGGKDTKFFKNEDARGSTSNYVKVCFNCCKLRNFKKDCNKKMCLNS